MVGKPDLGPVQSHRPAAPVEDEDVISIPGRVLGRLSRHQVQHKVHRVHVGVLPLEQGLAGERDVPVLPVLEDEAVRLVQELWDQRAKNVGARVQRVEGFPAEGEALLAVAVHVVRVTVALFGHGVLLQLSRGDGVVLNVSVPLLEGKVRDFLAVHRDEVVRVEPSLLLPRVPVLVHDHLPVQKRAVLRDELEARLFALVHPPERKPHLQPPNVKTPAHEVAPILHHQQEVPRAVRLPSHVVPPPL
mmetsp:Transcript_514/g.2048  ORF Transcript_514/g.2048 Transcript_514/m.2048 type:complete len:246 (-) Transcript_514:1065-1802(-)